jgi:hypothetical protein
MSENMPFWLPCYTLTPAIELLSELDWETANCLYEKFGENGTLGRETSSVVVRVIDWNEPSNNDFFLASQFWISG